MEFLSQLDRRQLFLLLASLPQLEGIDFSSLGTGADTDQFLKQANETIKACHDFMRRGGMNAVEAVLAQFLPRLERIASVTGEFQDIAAPLTVQAKILQIGIATRKGDFINRKLFCLDAVKFGELSGDNLFHVRALYWQGDTYIYCERNPKKARSILEEALGYEKKCDTHPTKSSILANISLAYAMEGDETNAQDYAILARKSIGEASIGYSDLDRSDGRMHLYLNEHFPDKGYAKMAYNAFERCLDVPDTDGYMAQTLIHKANASLMLGRLDEYTASLENGMQIALRIGSQELQSKANIAYGKAEAWKKEQRYIDLGRLF